MVVVIVTLPIFQDLLVSSWPCDEWTVFPQTDRPWISVWLQQSFWVIGSQERP